MCRRSLLGVFYIFKERLISAQVSILIIVPDYFSTMKRMCTVREFSKQRGMGLLNVGFENVPGLGYTLNITAT